MIEIDPDTKLGRIYALARGNAGRAEERFNCSAGLNEYHREAFVRAGMVVSARGEEGEARAVELPAHPFFLATLFMPQLSSAPGRPHPLLKAFLRAADGVG